MSIASSLTEKAGPLPVALWAVLVGGGLYWFVHRHSQGLPIFPVSNTTTPLDSGGGGQEFGSPAALAGPVLYQPNPMLTQGINSQPGAALAPAGSVVPTTIPVTSGGDNPFIGGYVGKAQATPYDYARGGPS